MLIIRSIQSGERRPEKLVMLMVIIDPLQGAGVLKHHSLRNTYYTDSKNFRYKDEKRLQTKKRVKKKTF